MRQHTLDPLDDRDLAPARARTGRHDPAHKADVRRFNQERANVVRDRLKVSEVVGTSVTLKRLNGVEFIGLCPFHGEKTPSFTVNDKKGFYHCFGCGAHGDAIGFVELHRGRSFLEALDILESEHGLAHLRASRPAPPKPAVRQVEEKRSDDAVLRIWRQTHEIRAGSFVDTYLRARGVVPPAGYGIGDPALNAGWPVDVRLHLELWHAPSRQALPAMILPYRKGGPDGEIVALHRTWLARHGRAKADVTPNKMHLGSRKGALIYLAALADDMTAGEGIETTLSCMQLWRLPGFCYGSADAMAAVEPPFVVSRLTIGADWNRGNRTGEKAAHAARKAFSVGRSIRVKVPDLRHLDKADFNDIAQLMNKGEWPPKPTPAGDAPKVASPPPKPPAPRIDRELATVEHEVTIAASQKVKAEARLRFQRALRARNKLGKDTPADVVVTAQEELRCAGEANRSAIDAYDRTVKSARRIA